VRRYVIVSLASGILFGALDGLINANPLAQRLYEVYRPIARASVNAPVGVAIDLVYGFVLAGIFLLLYASLPGRLGEGNQLWIARVVLRSGDGVGFVFCDVQRARRDSDLYPAR
jgi:hypothetical protein